MTREEKIETIVKILEQLGLIQSSTEHQNE